MNYKLIATDMDGTLLDEEHGITKENVEAIIKVQREKGVKFVLASGRPSYAMLEYAKELQMDKYEGYVLAFNGGELIDMKTNEVIFHEGLRKNDIENVYKVSKEIKHNGLSNIGKSLTGKTTTNAVKYFQKNTGKAIKGILNKVPDSAILTTAQNGLKKLAEDITNRD